ncbi:MAG: hypothetical protein AAB638_00710 [Patescibacteria group bacterium]
MRRILIIITLWSVAISSYAQNRAIAFDWFVGKTDYGLVSDLLKQSGNGSSDIQIRTSFGGSHGSSGVLYVGTWASGTAYSQYQTVTYPSASSPLLFRANQATTAGQSPDTHPAKWDLEPGVDIVQNLGSGKYARYTLSLREDDLIRINGIGRGSYVPSFYNRYSSTYAGNHGTGTATISTSSTSMAIPTSHPTARTLTIGTGLSLPNSSTLGSSSSSFAIPTTHPTALTINLGTGLSLVLGDNVTLYGDANNLVVYVIASYDSGTGIARGASTIHVGSGTFSSWTIKREKIIYFQRTADPANKNGYALLQTYDSGTGVLNFNTINNVGSTTNSDWTVLWGKSPVQPGTGNGLYINNVNNPAGTYGVWVWGEFTGTRLSHNSTKDNRGTGFLYIYGSGANDANIPADVTIDTYNATLVSANSTVTWSNLDPGTHTFLVLSKASPTGASANTRAWIDNDSDGPTGYSFAEQYDYDLFTEDVVAGPQGAQSFGEFAYNFRDVDGGDALYWLPGHGNRSTATGAAGRVFTIDGNVIDVQSENNIYLNKYVPFSNFSLTQSIDIIHPQASGNMGTLSTTHSFAAKSGLYYKQIFNWLQGGNISAGYNNMIILGDTWFNKFKCEDEQIVVRPPENTSVNLTGSQESQRSYLFYSTGLAPLSDFVIGMHWPNPSRDWRVGGVNRGTPFVSDFVGAGNAKFYPFIYSNYNFSTSETWTIEGRYYAGNKGALVLN